MSPADDCAGCAEPCSTTRPEPEARATHRPGRGTREEKDPGSHDRAQTGVGSLSTEGSGGTQRGSDHHFDQPRSRLSQCLGERGVELLDGLDTTGRHAHPLGYG